VTLRWLVSEQAVHRLSRARCKSWDRRSIEVL